MICLNYISKYIEQTANIIGEVLELDILIVDKNLKIVGDSDLESNSEDEYIEQTSILTKVMKNKELIILNNRNENPGCLICDNKDKCLVTMIIGIPLIFEGEVIGSIGILANSKDDKEKIIKNKENYLKFIDKMIELIINKLEQQQKFNMISLLNKRMEVVLDSLEQFIILVNKEGDILQTNINFDNIFRKKKPKNINEFLDNECVYRILNSKEDIKFKEVKIERKYDFLLSSKPVIYGEEEQGAVLKLRSLKEITEEINKLYNNDRKVKYDNLIGDSKEIKDIKEKIKQISNSTSILINGETGTGKEVVARLIHNTSNRKDEPFVAINCSAIPDELMESELFGYEEGAFSGAKKGGKIGKFQFANGGTIFLDEIGEMSIHLQAKLLRVLEEKRITKVGGLYSQKLDVRIISATNRNLEELVDKNMFREDLYYRLKVIPIIIPPLRERKDDIKILVYHFLKIYSKMFNKNIVDFSSDALKTLINYDWRGNVRELKNVVEFLVNMSKGDIITLDDFSDGLLKENRKENKILHIEKNTKQLIERALDKYSRTTTGKRKAANDLGISLATLYRKMKEYDIK